MVLADARDAATVFLEGRPPRPYGRTAPCIIGASKAFTQEIASHLDTGDVSPPSSGLAVFVDASIAASGVVLSADSHVVIESLAGTQDWDSFGDFVRSPGSGLKMTAPSIVVRRRFSGAPRILLRQAYDANYGHWLIECLPCLVSVAEHFDLSSCRFIVSQRDGNMRDIYLETLALCGIGADQIDVVGWEHVHVDTLIYPMPMTCHPWVKSPGIVEFLEAIAARIAPTVRGPSRIYVSRNNGRTRRLINEEAVLDIVRSRGFEIVHPEDMRFADQVEKFRDAAIVVGNCGAGLTNVVFCPRGVVLLALTTQAMQDDFFWDLVDLKDGTYVSLHGVADCETPELYSDFTIDTAIFERLLDKYLATVARCPVSSGDLP